MNQFLIEAFSSKMDGRTLRTLRFYVIAETVEIAVQDFRQVYPGAVIRTVWEFVQPSYYGSASADSDKPQTLLKEETA